MKMNKGVSDEGLARIAKTVKAQEGPPPEETEELIFEEAGDSDSKIEDLVHSTVQGTDWTFVMDDFGDVIARNAQAAGLNRAEAKSYALAVLSRMEDYIRDTDDWLDVRDFSDPSVRPAF